MSEEGSSGPWVPFAHPSHTLGYLMISFCAFFSSSSIRVLHPDMVLILTVYIKFHCNVPSSQLWDFCFCQALVSLLCHSLSHMRVRMAPQAALSNLLCMQWGNSEETVILSEVKIEGKNSLFSYIGFSVLWIPQTHLKVQLPSPLSWGPGRMQACPFSHAPILFFLSAVNIYLVG